MVYIFYKSKTGTINLLKIIRDFLLKGMAKASKIDGIHADSN